jgi:hypothetical protein
MLASQGNGEPNRASLRTTIKISLPLAHAWSSIVLSWLTVAATEEGRWEVGRHVAMRTQCFVFHYKHIWRDSSMPGESHSYSVQWPSWVWWISDLSQEIQGPASIMLSLPWPLKVCAARVYAFWSWSLYVKKAAYIFSSAYRSLYIGLSVTVFAFTFFRTDWGKSWSFKTKRDWMGDGSSLKNKVTLPDSWSSLLLKTSSHWDSGTTL